MLVETNGNEDWLDSNNETLLKWLLAARTTQHEKTRSYEDGAKQTLSFHSSIILKFILTSSLPHSFSHSVTFTTSMLHSCSPSLPHSLTLSPSLTLTYIAYCNLSLLRPHSYSVTLLLSPPQISLPHFCFYSHSLTFACTLTPTEQTPRKKV